MTISTLRLQSQASFTFVQNCPDQFSARTVHAPHLKTDYEKLASLGMLPLGEKISQSPSQTTVYGHFDHTSFSQDTDKSEIGVWGWAISPDDAWAATVVITKDNEPTFLGLTSASRPNPGLVKHLNSKQYSRSHWSTTIPMEEIGKGTHTLKAFVYSHKSGQLIPLDKTHTVTIQ